MNKKPLLPPLGSEDYREAAMLRLHEAQLLRDNKSWVGAVYLGGRAVEAMFRALLWVKTHEHGIRHDLHYLLDRVRVLFNFSESDDRRLEEAVNDVAILWSNDLRFTGEARFKRLLKASGRLDWDGHRRIKGDPCKANAETLLKACEAIVTRGAPYAKLAAKARKAF